MTRMIFNIVVYAGRTSVFLVGLAVMLALTVGLASTALAGTGVGARFDLGKANAVNQISKLVGSVAGPMVTIDNDSTGVGATALDLRVEPGKRPLTVNASAATATNLSADKLDGKDSTQSVRAGAPSMFAAGQIRPDGSVRNAVGAVGVAAHPTTGIYCVAFSEPVDDVGRLESAVVGLAGGQFEGRNFPRVVNGTGLATECAIDTLIVQVTDAAGNPQDGRFSFIVP